MISEKMGGDQRNTLFSCTLSEMAMKAAIVLVLLLVAINTTFATTVDGQVIEVTNNGSVYSVKIQLKVDVAAGCGGATLALLFNTTNLSYPASPAAGVDYVFSGFSGGSYSTAFVTRPTSNRVTASIEYNGGTATNIGTGWTDVVTINFTTLVASGSSNLTWATTQVLLEDQITSMTVGSFTGLNTNPLPVQLVTFTATSLQKSGSVTLKWATASETNNYGFEVQKAKDSTKNYQTIENSFVAGHGTTVEAHAYSFTDANATSGVWYYRLKQTDLDGAVHYSDGIMPSGTTGVTDKPLPTVFALDQNYPNPFNPSTMIEFALPKESRVTLEVYNLLGQRVATLVDEVRAAGYYTYRFDGSHYGSGVYFYRFSTPEVSFVRKMLLTK
jgi:hypothetical protein